MGQAIDKLADRLRETFLLHFEQELSYQEIAEQLNISYDNVRKRISQARAILREHLAEYLREEEGTNAYLKGRKSKQKEPVKDENLVLSEELKELEIVAGENEKPEQSEKPGFCRFEPENINFDTKETRFLGPGFCTFAPENINFDTKETRFLGLCFCRFAPENINFDTKETRFLGMEKNRVSITLGQKIWFRRFNNAVGTQHHKIMALIQNFNYAVSLQKCSRRHTIIIPIHAETLFRRGNTFNKGIDSS